LIIDIPNLIELDFSNIPLVHGYYSLGIIKKYRPDVELVFMRLSSNDQWKDSDLDCSLLTDIIQRHLDNNKIVFVVPFEEYVMNDVDYDFSKILNQFVDDPVYFVTEMDQEQSLYWRFQKNVKCKILEIPFILINDAVCYFKIAGSANQTPPESSHNFLCMVNRPESSKYDLLEKIYKLGLHKYGLVTYRDRHAPEFVKQNFIFNKNGPLDPQNLPTSNRQEAGQVLINNILVSSNVANYVHIQTTYDIPLIINPESTVGIFPATEKSLWPSLLGRMYLIYGHQRIMHWPQRFSSYGPENFCNMSFNNVEGYANKDHELRLEKMLVDNQYLIKHARDVYKQHHSKLEKNKTDFIFNLYNFFKNQISNLSTL
jgi:hypothetical protein